MLTAVLAHLEAALFVFFLLQATGLSIGIESTEVRAGSVVSLSAIRSDILGNNGEIEIPLANWSVPTGSLFVEQGKVKWIPSTIGNWTIGVQDQGYSSTILVMSFRRD